MLSCHVITVWHTGLVHGGLHKHRQFLFSSKWHLQRHRFKPYNQQCVDLVLQQIFHPAQSKMFIDNHFFLSRQNKSRLIWTNLLEHFRGNNLPAPPRERAVAHFKRLRRRRFIGFIAKHLLLNENIMANPNGRQGIPFHLNLSMVCKTS